MSRGSRRLHRDGTRHVLAILGAALGTAAALAVTLALRGSVEYAPTLLLGVTLLFGLYGPLFLWFTHLAFGRLRGPRLREHLERTKQPRLLERVLFVGGPKSWASLIVVIGVVSVLLLATGDAKQSLWLAAACLLCVVGTWILLVGVFAVEYMRAWALGAGLQFPGDADPTFPDFVYLSVQLSTTFSSSDVNLVTTSARRLATVHSIVAFAYSTVIIAVFASLLISMAA